MAAGSDRARRKPLNAAPHGPIRHVMHNSAEEGLIDSFDEIRRVQLYITSIIGVRDRRGRGPEKSPPLPALPMRDLSAGGATAPPIVQTLPAQLPEATRAISRLPMESRQFGESLPRAKQSTESSR